VFTITVCTPPTVTVVLPVSAPPVGVNTGVLEAVAVLGAAAPIEVAAVVVQSVTVIVAEVESITGAPPLTGVTVTVLTACGNT
jgi:hypothetical protein